MAPAIKGLNGAKILQMPKQRKINAPTASTAIPPEAGAGQPTIETTFVETVAIRKFIQFCLDDVQFQLKEMAKTKNLRPHQFKEAKYTAELLASYLLGLLMELDNRLKSQPALNVEADNAAS